MTRTVVNRTAAARRGRIVLRAREALSSSQDVTEALDRSTPWPVHRIRWFLQSQSGQTHRRCPSA